MAKKIKEPISLFFRGWIGSILIAVLVATSIKSAIADWYVVPTGSMKPTIVEGDRIFANKLAYDLKIPYTTWHIAQWDNPERGDIVVFNSPADDKCLVKRVIGLPGDSIAMRNNQLFINGEAIKYESIEQENFEAIAKGQSLEHLFYDEDLLGKSHAVMITPLTPSPRSFAPVIVPEGHYFMMGDNRDNSADSRYFGFVKRGEILGRATNIVISLDKTRHYKPRWDRFFSKLP
ncbi:MAG: signal peptidase I [Deltaproteobacteria bacterium]|nr:signal peptidase I [Deltaproteobacteria bacterium]